MLSLCPSPAAVKTCPTCYGERAIPNPFGYPNQTLPCPACCPREQLPVREWPVGSRVEDAAGRPALLLGTTWETQSGFAWLLYDDLAVPVTVPADGLRLLELPEDHPDDRGCDVCDEERPF
jgi:hypothetical protein